MTGLRSPEDLLQRRSEPEARAVLEDYLQEHGRSVRSILPTHGGYNDGFGGGDGSRMTVYWTERKK